MTAGEDAAIAALDETDVAVGHEGRVRFRSRVIRLGVCSGGGYMKWVWWK